MAKENPDTKSKPKSAFQKFEQLAAKIVRVPKDKAQDKEAKRSR